MTTQQLALRLLTTACGVLSGLICMAAIVAAVTLVSDDKLGPLTTFASLAGLLVLTLTLNKALLAAMMLAHDQLLEPEHGCSVLLKQHDSGSDR